jgi:hypothetical protein
MTDTQPQYVWIAEAYDKYGTRVERIVHRNEDDAREDIAICAPDDATINVTQMRVYAGSDYMEDT